MTRHPPAARTGPLRRPAGPGIVSSVNRTPDADVPDGTALGDYVRWLAARGHTFAGYEELWRWSIEDLDAFWTSIWEYFQVQGSHGRALGSRDMPGAQWFPGARLNYAEHMLGRPEDRDTVALIAYSQTRERSELTFGELAEQVGRARAGLRRLGVGRGDRVVAFVPNIPEALVAFLACASLGAIWASCAPEFGARSVVDRVAQIEPTVLIAVAGYTYGAEIDKTAELAAIRAGLPTLRHVVGIGYGATGARRAALGGAAGGARSRRVGRRRIRAGALRPPAVRAVLVGHDGASRSHRARPRRDPAGAPQVAGLPPRHPPGRPGPVVHHHRVGDVEHHVSALLRGATLVVVDGNPLHPDLRQQWRIAAEPASRCWAPAQRT